MKGNKIKGWRQMAGLCLKKSALPAAGVTLLTMALQLAGTWAFLAHARAENFSAVFGSETLPLVPRLEIAMSGSGWYLMFTAGLLGMLLVVFLLPIRLAGKNRTAGLLRRMPAGKWAMALGSAVNAFCLLLVFYAAEFSTVFMSNLLYKAMVPAEKQLADALLMALLRWEVLRGLFPAALPGMFGYMAGILLVLSWAVAGLGLLLAEKRLRRWHLFALMGLTLATTPFLYTEGLQPNKYGVLAVSLILLTNIFIELWRALKADPLE